MRSDRSASALNRRLNLVLVEERETLCVHVVGHPILQSRMLALNDTTQRALAVATQNVADMNSC